MMEINNAGRKEHPRERGFFGQFVCFRGGWKGLLLLWAVLLPFKIMRAREENSFWVDEIYSVMMAHKPVSEIVYYDAQHDNLYFLVLKIWIGIGNHLSLFPRLFWARLLNLLMWMIFSIFVWFGCRNLLGNFQGTLLSWAVLSGSMAAHITKEIRSYATPSFALFVCFMIIVLIWKRVQERGDEPKSSFRSRIKKGVWIVYILLALVASCFNFLGALLLCSMTLAWFFLGIQRKKKIFSVFYPGMIAHILALILFLPWLLLVRERLAGIQSQNRLWMTPCTLANFLRVFFFWFPYGPLPVFQSMSVDALLYVAGIISVLLPWGCALWGGIYTKPGEKDDSFLLKTGLLASVICIYYILLLFLLDSLFGIKIFHGPRYPSLAVPIWTWGLVAAALWAGKRMKLHWILIVLILAPWFLCSFGGQFWMQDIETRGGLYQWKTDNIRFFPDNGSDLYVFPSELIDYFPENLKDYKVKTTDELGSVPPQVRDVFLLDLNNWKEIRPVRDEMIMKLISSGRLSYGLVIKEYSPKFSPFRNYILLDYRHEDARKILADGIRASFPQIPPYALAMALPEDQKIYEGWSVLEMGKDNRIYRWGNGEISKIRFHPSLEPGKYVVHIIGYRNPYPAKHVLMKFNFHDEKDEFSLFQDKGYLHIRIPVRITRTHTLPRLIVRQDSWRPSEYIEGSPDGRNLTFLFLRGWIE
ncbi:hypothetical protein JW926_15830 [Candidatus Sumerlaeota bacterium]|nr:hypothetical protein [Candidatus Sumerlaeota bacterium]